MNRLKSEHVDTSFVVEQTTVINCWDIKIWSPDQDYFDYNDSYTDFSAKVSFSGAGTTV